MTGTSQAASTTMNVYSVQTTDGATVKARIEKVWINQKLKRSFYWFVRIRSK